jgi:hypothetical protein
MRTFVHFSSAEAIRTMITVTIWTFPLLLLGVTWMGVPGAAIQVFDCTDEATTVQAIDLLQPAECPDPKRDYRKPREAHVQLIQTSGTTPVEAYQCSLRATREVSTCGWWDSRSYGTRVTEWQKAVELSPAECIQILQENRLTFEGKNIAITPGAVGAIMWYTHGSLGVDGRCKWGDFWSGGTHFTNAYERLELQWEFNRVKAVVDIHAGKITFNSGLRTDYAKGLVKDTNEGLLTWDIEAPVCREAISGIFFGKAEIHEPVGTHPSDLRGSIVMIKNEDHYAGLVLRKAVNICGMMCYPAHLPNLLLCTGVDAEWSDIKYKPEHSTKEINVQSQMSHLHLGTNLKLYKCFEEVQADICQLDRKILFNKLQAIAGVKNPYSLVDLYGPGHQVIVAGAAAYVARCAEKEATRTTFVNCTMEVPVDLNGTLQFADPQTWVLQKYPTIIQCSDVMPVRWKVGLQWYCSYPETRPCSAPPRLNTTTLTYSSENFVDGLGKGAYSKEQLQRHMEFVVAQSTRGPALNKLTNSVASGGSTIGGMGVTVPGGDMDILSLQFERFLYPQIALFGRGWHLFVGCLLVAMICKIILGCLIRAWVLYRERGVGVWMLASLWHATFLLVRAPLVMVAKGVEELVEPLENQPGKGGVRRDGPSVNYYKGVREDIDVIKEEAIHFKFDTNVIPENKEDRPRPLL